MSFRFWASALVSLTVCSAAFAGDHHYVREWDQQGRRHFTRYNEYGNRQRIARLVDASITDISQKTLIATDPVGRPRLILMPTFGNRLRIEKLVGAY